MKLILVTVCVVAIVFVPRCFSFGHKCVNTIGTCIEGALAAFEHLKDDDHTKPSKEVCALIKDVSKCFEPYSRHVSFCPYDLQDEMRTDLKVSVKRWIKSCEKYPDLKLDF